MSTGKTYVTLNTCNDYGDNMTQPEKTYGTARRLGTDFVSAVIVGLVLGYWIDRFFETTPIFLIIFLILGALAGFRNVYKYATKVISKDNNGDDHA